MTYKINDAYLAYKVYDETLQKGGKVTSPDGSQWTVLLLSPPNASDYQGMPR